MTALLAALGLWVQVLAPPQDPPQFKTGIDVRRLDVVVLDRDGRPVHGLSAADFTILEDGKPQKIATVDEIVVPEPEPARTEWMRDVAPDVATNSVPLDGRLMVIVLDDALNREVHVIEPARKIARAIVDRMGPASIRTLARASEYLRGIEGRRKALFYISVGVPVDWEDISTPVQNLGEEG